MEAQKGISTDPIEPMEGAMNSYDNDSGKVPSPHKNTTNSAESQDLSQLYSLIGEDEEVVQQEQDAELSEELRCRFIDLSKPYPEIENTLSIGGVGCFPIGDIVAFKAKAKQGKTLTNTAIIVAMIKGNYMGFTALKKGLRVLFVDTEQNPLNTAKLAKKVHKLCGFDTDRSIGNFSALNLRGDSPIERRKFISEAIEAIRPDVVFIDGIKDLVETDINDQVESGKVTQYLMSLTIDYRIVLVAVLHTNKAITDSNMRGALGTEITNKASEVWEVKKDGDIFNVSQDISRNAPADGFSFTLNEWNEPTPIDYVPKISRTEAKFIKMEENFRESLPLLTSKTYSELCTIYSETAGVSVKTAQTHVGEAVKKKFIERGRDGNYRFNPSKP